MSPVTTRHPLPHNKLKLTSKFWKYSMGKSTGGDKLRQWNPGKIKFNASEERVKGEIKLWGENSPSDGTLMCCPFARDWKRLKTKRPKLSWRHLSSNDEEKRYAVQHEKLWSWVPCTTTNATQRWFCESQSHRVRATTKLFPLFLLQLFPKVSAAPCLLGMIK